MRPTDCDFLSPRNRTGEYVYPLVTAYGTKLAYEKQYPLTTTGQKNHTMTLEKRFRRALTMEKHNATLPGPCDNDTRHPHKSIEGTINKSHHAVRDLVA